MSSNLEQKAQDKMRNQFSNGQMLDEHSFRINGQSLASTNALSESQNYPNGAPSPMNQSMKDGTKSKLTFALDQMKKKNLGLNMKNVQYDPQIDEPTPRINFEDSICANQRVDVNLSHNPQLYHDQNIEEALRSIIKDESDSDVGQKEILKKRKSVLQRIQAVGWVEILLFITIIIIAFMGRNQITTNQRMEQMLIVMNDQAAQLKVQKGHIYKVMKQTGVEVQLENDIQAQNAKKIAGLKATVKDAQRQIATLHEENVQVKKQLEDIVILRQDMALTQKRLEKTETEEKSIKSGLSTINKALDSNIEETGKNQDQISKISDSLQKQEQQLQKENDKLKKLLTETKSLQKEAEDSEETLSEIQKNEKKLDKKLGQSIETITKQNAKQINALQSDVTRHSTDLQAVQKENERLVKVLTTVRASVQGIESDGSRTKEEVRKLNAFMEQMKELTSAEEDAIES